MYDFIEDCDDMTVDEQRLYLDLGPQCRWLEAVEIAARHGYTPRGLNWVMSRHPQLFHEEEDGDVIECCYVLS